MKADPVILTDDERRLLDRIAGTAGERAVAKRAAVVLLAAEGLSNRSISERLRLEEHCIGRWRRRFARQRIWGLFDQPRSGRPVSRHDCLVWDVSSP
ncbi:helix-turn-helix domain-containing protein [Inquilinus sp. OTU3971]|uniref:helix-turn-helix domain-containing protein n=1 Tax=Inquilinus sp. OTU3971 TaxID=3043855 RepID=UPI00313EA28B